MKIIQTKFLCIFFLIAIISFTSCQKADLLEPTVEKTHKKGLASAAKGNKAANFQPVTINGLAFNSISNPFTITSLTIEDEIIMITAGYQGGCGTVDFILVSDGNVNNYNGIPMVNLKLVLYDNDPCKNFMETDLSFDLTPIHQQGSSTMLLNINGYGTINYNY